MDLYRLLYYRSPSYYDDSWRGTFNLDGGVLLTQ
jgi:hypothetical protein